MMAPRPWMDMRPAAAIAIASCFAMIGLVVEPGVAMAQSDPAPGEGAAATTSDDGAPATDDIAPLVVDEAVARALCNGFYGGPFAVLGLWAVDDQLVAIELRGDLTTFSHPPSVFYAPDGTERAIVAEAPVVPGSPEALATEAVITEATSGGTLVETRSCAPFYDESTRDPLSAE